MAKGTKKETKPEAKGPAGKVEKKKKGGEIDSIFNAVKKAKEVAEEEEAGAADEGGEVDERRMRKLADKIKKARTAPKKAEAGGKKGKEAGKAVAGSKDDLFGDGPKGARKRTADGLILYSEKELGFDKKEAGNTPDCPFDCDCCY